MNTADILYFGRGCIVRAQKMSSMADQFPPVVSTQWLNNQLSDNTDRKLAVLDATWSSTRDTIELIQDFSKRHILGASFLDLFRDVKNTPLYPRNLPDPPSFQLNIRGAAVNKEDHVIIYESTGHCGFLTGARAWWMFKLFGHDKVSVLDGGLEKWTDNGFETTNMMAKKAEGNFRAQKNSIWIKGYDDMVDNLSNKRFQVCDSRAQDKFHGNAEDPRSGHYPGASNIPFSSLFDNTETLKNADNLKQVFADAGVNLSEPIVTMCNSGMSSCTLALAAHLCGCPEVSVYHGGFLEWKAKVDSSQIASVRTQ